MSKVSEEKASYQVYCRMCSKPHYIVVYPSDLARFEAGTHAQDAFPYLSADDRELLISGTCDECWNKMFSDDD